MRIQTGGKKSNSEVKKRWGVTKWISWDKRKKDREQDVWQKLWHCKDSEQILCSRHETRIERRAATFLLIWAFVWDSQFSFPIAWLSTYSHICNNKMKYLLQSCLLYHSQMLEYPAINDPRLTKGKRLAPCPAASLSQWTSAPDTIAACQLWHMHINMPGQADIAL